MSNLTNRQVYKKGMKSFTPAKVKVTARENAEGQDCTLNLGCCNHNPATTVLAHLRFFGLAGMAQKPPEFLAVFACSDCHDAIDGRKGTKSSSLWGFEDILRALCKTLIIQFQDGIFRQ